MENSKNGKKRKNSRSGNGSKSKKIKLPDGQLSPDELERVNRRRNRNREAAKRCREKRDKQVSDLENTKADLAGKNRILIEERSELQNQIDKLKIELNLASTVTTTVGTTNNIILQAVPVSASMSIQQRNVPNLVPINQSDLNVFDDIIPGSKKTVIAGHGNNRLLDHSGPRSLDAALDQATLDIFGLN